MEDDNTKEEIVKVNIPDGKREREAAEAKERMQRREMFKKRMEASGRLRPFVPGKW